MCVVTYERQVEYTMRYLFVMFVTAVCFLFLVITSDLSWLRSHLCAITPWVFANEHICVSFFRFYNNSAIWTWRHIFNVNDSRTFISQFFWFRSEAMVSKMATAKLFVIFLKDDKTKLTFR